MTIQTICVNEVCEKLKQGAILVDIRQPDEYLREHIEGAELHPLSQLEKEGLTGHAVNANVVIFHCRSGRRTQQASELLAALTTGKEAFILEGGLEGWKANNQPTRLNRSQPLEMMRQVQIAAGSLTLIGAVLGWLVSPVFYGLCAFVGAGLLLAGATGFCGMARLLALMPWNRP
ncbi:rhodanese family protein [Bisgaard Taxon 45]